MLLLPSSRLPTQTRSVSYQHAVTLADGIAKRKANEKINPLFDRFTESADDWRLSKQKKVLKYVYVIAVDRAHCQKFANLLKRWIVTGKNMYGSCTSCICMSTIRYLKCSELASPSIYLRIDAPSFCDKLTGLSLMIDHAAIHLQHASFIASLQSALVTFLTPRERVKFGMPLKVRICDCKEKQGK